MKPRGSQRRLVRKNVISMTFLMGLLQFDIIKRFLRRKMPRVSPN